LEKKDLKKMSFNNSKLDMNKNIKVLAEAFKDNDQVTITEDNYSMYFRMDADKKRCSVCKGLFNCKNDSKGYRSEVFLKEGILYEKFQKKY